MNKLVLLLVDSKMLIEKPI